MRLKIHRAIVVGKVIKLAAEAVEQVKGIEPSTSDGRGTVFNLPVSHETG
jgi:hypothetical protein